MKFAWLMVILWLPCEAWTQTVVEAAPATETPATSPDTPSERLPVTSAQRGYLEDLFGEPDKVNEAIDAIVEHLKTERQAPLEEAEPAEVRRLGVRDCVAIALSRNAQVFVAEEDLAAAQARVGQARAAILPQVTGRFAITHLEQDIAAQTAGLGGGFGLESLGVLGLSLAVSDLSGVARVAGDLLTQAMAPDLTPDETIETAQVSIVQVLYAGGRLRAVIEAAQFLAQSQEWRKEAAFAEVEFQTKQAFYDALLASGLVRVAEESVRTFQRNLSDAQHMYDVGWISNFEVLRARTELGARQAGLVAARNAGRLALANLRRILFFPQDAPLELIPEIAWAPPSTSVEELVLQAYERRPEIRALESAIAAAEQDLRRVKGQYKPRIAANADYLTAEGAGPTVSEGWTFTVGAEWELVAGGRRRQERAEARAKLSSLCHQLEDLKRLVELDATQAFIQIQDAMAKVESERGTVELAREGLRLAELRFQEGVGTQSETLDAELALTNAETKLLQALRDYAVANAALQRATGSSWFTQDSFVLEETP